MTEWHGYILLEKPGAITMGEWRDALLALYGALDNHPDDPQPCRRLHWRFSMDNTLIIIESVFLVEQLVLDYLAGVIHEALPQYTLQQIKTAIINMTTIFRPGEEWTCTGNKARAYLRDHAAEWEVIE